MTKTKPVKEDPGCSLFFLFVCLYFSYLSLKEHCVVVRKIFIDFFFFALLPKQTE